MFIIEKLTDKELGAVFTPSKTANYIVSRLGTINKDKFILDPCVGMGAFIEALLKKGVEKDQIFSFDICENYKNNIENFGVKFNTLDSLLMISQEDYNVFDFIIGNPPYLNKASKYIKRNKKKLQKIYGKINSHETYAMFIINSIWRLKEGGILGFITSDSFLSLNTHTKLRNFILKNCLINEILLAPKNLFSQQEVSINPAIIILTKCSGPKNSDQRKKNVIKLISRVSSEDEYWNPGKITYIEQKKYELLPFNIFFIDVEDRIIELFKSAPKLEDFLKGYIGMHTHDNQNHIAAIEGTDLAEIFKNRNKKILNTDKHYKIIEKQALDTNNWKPYLKRGGNDQYYRPIMEALDWKLDSKKLYDIPKKIPFEKEGIVISGISSRLAARYMPSGCYWDSNKSIGFILKDKTISISYFLGLLNSSFYNYLAKGIINNTNSLQITGIHALPFIIPDEETKKKVEKLVEKIIQLKKLDLYYDYKDEQEKIDELIFKLYSKKYHLSDELKHLVKEKYSICKNRED